MEPALNLKHLRVFLAAARLGSLARAALSVHLSQPAATQAIRKLEAGLGMPLFERAHHGVTPTEAGCRFRDRVERAFDWLAQARKVLGPEGHRLEASVSYVQLRAVIAITEWGSFSLAARQLGISQPSVHRAAREFEALCGQSLFLATPQGVEATSGARELARCAALTLAELHQGTEELREMRGILDGWLVVGCLPLARTRIVPRAILELLRTYPAVKVRIVDGAYQELLHGLRHGRIDMIVGALRTPTPASDVVQEPLFSDPLSIVVRAGHPILRHGMPAPDELARLQWVVPRQGSPARQQFEAFFVAVQVPPPENVIECSSLVALRGLLVESDRAGILSAEQVHYEVEAGFLSLLPAPLPGTDRVIGLTFRSGWHATTVQNEFVRLIRQSRGESS